MWRNHGHTLRGHGSGAPGTHCRARGIQTKVPDTLTATASIAVSMLLGSWDWPTRCDDGLVPTKQKSTSIEAFIIFLVHSLQVPSASAYPCKNLIDSMVILWLF